MAHADIRRGALWVLALTLTVINGTSVAQTPDPATKPSLTVLEAPATRSVRAQRGVMLAVARAGQRLVAAGERGTVLLSDDNGLQWRQARVPVRATLTAMQFVNARTGWAVGHFGVVLRTDDGGESWSLQLDGDRAAKLAQGAADSDEAVRSAAQLVEDGPDKPLLALHFTNAENGLVVGAYNLALRTNDGGKTWRYIGHELPNPRRLHLYGIATQGSRVLVAGEQGLLMFSDDDGQHFISLAPPYPGSYFGALGARTGTVLVYGLRGTVFRSDDGGQSWQRAEVPSSQALSSALVLSDQRLLLASQAGELMVSSDDGKTFAQLPAVAKAPMPVTSLAQADNGSLVLGTLRGPVTLPLPR